ncbi:MAG: carbon storage regulator CsrA [Desulfobulbaceae bacterium]|nr:carbon storage regulator CsrA [Desulfobulbaceae bacterium]
MLILTRKAGEAIAINDNITVTVIEMKGGQVKLGIEAPRHVAIHREEVLTRILEENKRATETTGDLPALDAILKHKKTA